MSEEDEHKPQPSLRPTTAATLFVFALAGGSIMLLWATRAYPPIPNWYTPLTLLALAIALTFAGFNIRSRISRKPGAERVEPLVIARFAALAKACAIGGALLSGGYAGVLIYTFIQRTVLATARADLPTVVFGLVCCVLLMASGLWLEYACRIPKKDDDDEENGGARSSVH